MSQCTAIKPNGERCKGRATGASEWCWNHDPAHAGAHRRHGSKGGRRAGRGRPQTEINAAKERLWQLAEDTLAGEVDKGTAAVVSQILNVYLKACAVGLDAQERLEILPRLEELEALVAARKADRWQA